MIYRRFGRTGLKMPVFSCGGMRYQHKWQDVPAGEIPPENQRNLECVIDRSLAAGINHIETARGYGSSERQLGFILPKVPREKLIVQTKVGPAETSEQFTRDFEDSLARLQLDHVDLLAVHGVNDAQTLSWTIRPGGCLSAARAIQRRGLARHVGFSTHGPTSIIVRAVEHDGDGGFDYVNLHWYYIMQRNWPAIEAATERDMGVFIISPSDKGGMLYDPPKRLVELCRPLHPVVFNDLFCLQRPEVHTLSIGAKRPGDFDLHVEAAAMIESAGGVVSSIVARLEEAYYSAVEPALRNPFEMNLPEWEQTPGQVNVPIILWLRNLIAAYDMKDYARMRYNLLGNGGHWFPGNNASELDEPALRRALGGIEGAEVVIAHLRQVHELVGGPGVKRLSEGG